MRPSAAFLFSMMMRCAAAYRIMLGPSAYPYLATETGATLRWADAERLALLHRARWVEVAPRGIRVGVDVAAATAMRRWSDPVPCALSPAATAEHALCATARAVLLPSPAALGSAEESNYSSPSLADSSYYVVGAFFGAFGAEGAEAFDAVAEAYARADACALHGVGRVLPGAPGAPGAVGAGNNNNNYTVTACDVMDGHLVALFDLDAQTVRLAPQTFGPMAYSAVLLASVGCLFFATAISSSSSSAGSGASGGAAARAALTALALVSACALLVLVHGAPFVTDADGRFFWAECAFAVFLAVRARATANEAQGGEACAHALAAMACAVYRTPENAYAGLLCAVLLVRLWGKLLAWPPPAPAAQARTAQAFFFFEAADILGSTALTAWGARIGVAPQFAPASARFPFFAGVALFISFVFALQRHQPLATLK